MQVLQRHVLPKLRRILQLTQEQIATSCGCTSRQVHNWELNGMPFRSWLLLVAYNEQAVKDAGLLFVLDEDGIAVIDVIHKENFCGLLRVHNLRHLIRSLDIDTHGKPYMRYTHFMNETNTGLMSTVSEWPSLLD